MAESAEEENEQLQEDEVEEIVLSDDEERQQHHHQSDRSQHDSEREKGEEDKEAVLSGSRKRQRRQTQRVLVKRDDDDANEDRQVEEAFISDDEQRVEEWSGEQWEQAADEEFTIVSAVRRRKVKRVRPSQISSTTAINAATHGVQGQSRPASNVPPSNPTTATPDSSHHSQPPAAAAPFRPSDAASPSSSSSTSSSYSLLSTVSSSCSRPAVDVTSSEPPSGPGVVRIQLRLPGGSTVQRRFTAASTASTLRSFIAHSLQTVTGSAGGGRSERDFRVLSLHPRREVELRSEWQSTLQSLDVGNATLIVEWKD